MPGGKREQNVWFNLFFPSAGEFRSWLTADVHLFKQNKDRVTLTYRFTFHSSAISRCQSLHCVSSSNKKSCWHAACLRGVIHHCERKEAQDEYIQKDVFTCVHYFNFNFSCSQPPNSSMQPQPGPIHPTETKANMLQKMRCALRIRLPRCIFKSPQVNDKGEQLANADNKAVPLNSPTPKMNFFGFPAAGQICSCWQIFILAVTRSQRWCILYWLDSSLKMRWLKFKSI